MLLPQSYYTRTSRRAQTASVDSCAEIKSAPSVVQQILPEFGGRCRKAMLGVCCISTLIPVHDHRVCCNVLLSRRVLSLMVMLQRWGTAEQESVESSKRSNSTSQYCILRLLFYFMQGGVREESSPVS